MNTRRHPRTLQEAFGPYTSRDISDPKGETPAWWTAIVCIAAVGAVIVWVTR